MVRRIAVRKILVASRAVRTTYVVAAASLVFSIIGLMLYAITKSDVVLMEGLVWLVEAMSFGGLAVAFKIAASRALMYRSRYEVLRLESLAVLLTSLVALFVIAIVIIRNMMSPHERVTPIIFSIYLFGSGIASLLLERYARRGLRIIGLRIVSINAISEKLSLDFLLETGGGAAIVASNLLKEPIIEAVTSIIMGLYVAYGVLGITREAVYHLIGITPYHVYRELRAKVLSTLRQATRYSRVRRLKIESYGTFYEVEMWLEAPPGITLGTAHRESMRIAHRIVHEIPEVLRALIVFVPSRDAAPPPRSLKRYTKKRIREKQSTDNEKRRKTDS
ncbi:hypothetical protein PYJP_18170 [Pyrofollis japonicus]|uniref:cation diffusion facilitator family transporter n=1 Tax=Pyrofollis japonicus TaxID=3060460 RepID=UPI00295BBB5C|nr:cation transporter [Pyrofollis japonicus]BEP18465.1 hypothetical protein PYJP_18170 [Pyrofollis japonicus]